ncbi:DUF6167 family protein [Streptacidiphilus sp. EB129]|jgi:hypothetical protein|uniref:DUF6167 family protein n=1 Tax=Streptacidiphilus sp. EB129 TaxID=3156262 RepID=UPI003516A153
MRRIFWMAVGAGATVWTLNKANQVARSLTPGSLADSAARGAVDVGEAVRSFAGEVRAGMVQRELELNRQLGLDGSVLAAPGTPGAPVLRGSAAQQRVVAQQRLSDRKRVALSPAAPSTTDITPYNRNEDN